MATPIRLMLVDDSAVVRGLLARELANESSIEVVASASNGQMAISVLGKHPVDVMILDVEMPIMSGIDALPELLKISPKTRIIMSSSLTQKNAEMTLRAMQIGAADCIAKPSTRDASEVGDFYRNLIAKIKALAPQIARPLPTPGSPAPILAAPIVAPTVPLRKIDKLGPINALAIASSTGGPQALLSIFKEFKGIRPRMPIFITQHMPPNFTTILADHISKASGLDCHEARAGEEVKPGVIYVAPGDFHMTVTRDGVACRLQLDQNPQENFCRPSADPMLRSLAKAYGDKLLVTVLTGLGADGARGASEVVATGGIIVAQDEASSVVYGMPKAVADAKLTSAVFPLNSIAPFLIKVCA